MRIAIASDHRGYHVKEKILAVLRQMEHTPQDFGPDNAGMVDYPDFAAKVASAVSKGDVDRGILICGTGMGMCIVANKFPGVRATNCHDDLTAENSRLHNDANVLCLSADLLGERLVNRMIELWLKTEFEGGRHTTRVEKIMQYESRNGHSDVPPLLSTQPSQSETDSQS